MSEKLSIELLHEISDAPQLFEPSHFRLMKNMANEILESRPIKDALVEALRIAQKHAPCELYEQALAKACGE
jgi:hypothetical protein